MLKEASAAGKLGPKLYKHMRKILMDEGRGALFVSDYGNLLHQVSCQLAQLVLVLQLRQLQGSW